MYTIIKREFIGYNGNSSVWRVDIVVDTEADIPDPEPHWSTGSMALIAETQDIKILSNKGAWV